VSYQVFARKYRPQTFDDLVGQTHVVRTLKNAIEQNRLAHAYLFVGPRGTGKTSTARILAKALNCIHGPTVTPCGVCDSCKEIAGGNSLDVLELDAASNRGIDDVRELRDNVRYAPARGKYKVYIIDEVHSLTKDAANALLKTLEEPPQHVIFCLATTEPEKLPITILSRCQRFDLHRIPANLIAEHLEFIAKKEKVQLEPSAAHAIARGADGGLRDAESMLDQLVAFCGETIAESDVLNVFGFTSEQTVAEFTGRILRGETAEALALLDEQMAAGKDMMTLMSNLITHLRDLLVFKVKPDALAEEAGAELQSSLGQEAALIETDRLLELIEQFAEAEGRMKWAPNKKLHFEVAVIKAIQTLGQVTLTDVIENLTALRGGGETLVRSALPQTQRSSPKPSPEKKPAAASAIARDDRDTPVAAPAATPQQSGNVDSISSDLAMMWPKAVQLISTRRPLIKTWIDSATLLGTEDGCVSLGFAPDHKTVMESLARPPNRVFLEGLFKELTGTDWKLKLSLVEGLSAPAPPSETSSEPEQRTSKPDESFDSFKDDPLIRAALEIFKGEIKSVTT
jgi:DNA polymerase-3 subunit gamma/tau